MIWDATSLLWRHCNVQNIELNMLHVTVGLLYVKFVFSTWASYQIRKLAGCACAGNAGNVSPRRWLQRKPLVSNPGMHHGTCVTHVPWGMSGLLTRGGGETVHGIHGACAVCNFTYLARGPWRHVSWKYINRMPRAIFSIKKQSKHN